MLSSMPEEILLTIMTQVDQWSRGRCACTSKQLHGVCESPHAWRSVRVPLSALRCGSLSDGIEARLKHAHALEVDTTHTSPTAQTSAESTSTVHMDEEEDGEENDEENGEDKSLLAPCGSLSDEGVAMLISHTSSPLRAIDLTGCAQLTASTLNRLLCSFPRLEKLRCAPVAAFLLVCC